MFTNVNRCFISFNSSYWCNFDVKSGRIMRGHVVISADTTLRVSAAIFMTMVNRYLVKLRYHWGLRNEKFLIG
jgi:hypothetical protein